MESRKLKFEFYRVKTMAIVPPGLMHMVLTSNLVTSKHAKQS